MRTPADQIAHLTNELAKANERARVAEEQLHRVYVAVREYKARQLAAQEAARASRREAVEAAAQAALAQASPESAIDRTGLYTSWGTPDPGLDERLDEFLANDIEPDRARNWILGG